MTSHLQRRIAVLSAEIEQLTTELSILAERLTEQARVLEDRQLRLFVAETPVADRDHREALAGRDRIVSEIALAKERLAELVAERDRLERSLGAERARRVG